MTNATVLTQEPITPIPNPGTSHSEEVELGRILFHDVRLSKGDQLSCASCHSLSRYGGADGQKVSTGVDGQQGNINSPSVFNASLNFRHYWNGRAANLMEQIDGPINNPLEMGSKATRNKKTTHLASLFVRLPQCSKSYVACYAPIATQRKTNKNPAQYG